MSVGNLALRNAGAHVRLYSEEAGRPEPDVMELHAEAMDCRNCEDLIHMGIDAFQWIMRADQAYRIALYGGREEELNMEREIAKLCSWWLDVSARQEPKINAQVVKGFKLDRLDEYRRCVTEMVAIVESLNDGDNQTLPDSLIGFRDSAIQEFHNGEAAEFF